MLTSTTLPARRTPLPVQRPQRSAELTPLPKHSGHTLGPRTWTWVVPPERASERGIWMLTSRCSPGSRPLRRIMPVIMPNSTSNTPLPVRGMP